MKVMFSIVLFILLGCHLTTDSPTGGYDYPKSFTGRDTSFYYYPIKDIEPKRESFQDYYNYLFFQPFDELNLSLKALPNEIFRFHYSTAFGDALIIDIKEDRLVIKQGNPGTMYNESDSLLTDTEKYHLNFLRKNYPFDTTSKGISYIKYFDSVVKLYPELLDVSYYHSLYEKTFVRKNEKFKYSIKTIPLTREQYVSLIVDINSSGFWNLPFRIKCKEGMMDGYGFTLEANTKNKYNVVTVNGCPGDSSRFTKACQNIIELADLDKKISLIWNWNDNQGK